MVALFSWLIVLSGLLYFLGIFTVPFINDALMPYIVILSFAVGIISAIGLIIVLIKERYKDKKEEDRDDLSKY